MLLEYCVFNVLSSYFPYFDGQVNAMEVSGVEGTFRATCESVMNVLRDNKDILMAMLEAFVHDPLINWRLLSTEDDTDSENITTTTTGSSRTRSRPRSRSNPEVGVENAGVDDSDSDIRSSALNVGKVDDEVDGSGSLSPNNIPDPSYRDREKRESLVINALEGFNEEGKEEVVALNARALIITQRIEDKLTGHDFESDKELAVSDQVNRLILQATSSENLCQLYLGWCPFW